VSIASGIGWPLIADDPSDVAATQIVPGVIYGAAEGTGGGSIVQTDGTVVPAASSPTVQSFSTTGIIPVTVTVQIPFNDGVNVSAALIGQNLSRGTLVLQNLSTASVSGDVPPTLFIGFGIPAQVNAAFALLPGVGIWLDRAVPTDAIFVAWGPFENAGGSVIISGFAGSASIVPSVPS
jgi:hypothetical protein